MQGIVNKAHGDFVAALARNRGTSAGKVNSQFGQGRMMMADDAKKVGMIDGIRTLTDVVMQAMDGSKGAGGRKLSASASASTDFDLDLRRRRWRQIQRGMNHG